ncbi:MAG: N-acetylmuramoyl-L-alanine amidase [Pseudomonadota bacterium]|nr:N-acetylmuramoyl-L-alanine amidase [Pseudomonadota bacterium]
MGKVKKVTSMEIIKTPSPNFNDRKGCSQPSLIIVHYTGTKTADEAAAYYLNTTTDPNAGPISPHYMIDADGTLFQFVDEDKRAWHAGVSTWKGETDINSLSIGIELVNEGEYADYPPFADAQIDMLVTLCRAIQARYDIPAADVIGHDDIAPDRKKDPGPSFPWTEFRKRLKDI